MANQLVPYIQDEQKWIKNYMAQVRKQIEPKEMMKVIKEKPVQPSIVLPTMQLVAQAESELKHQQNEAPVFAPIKATPEFESTHSASLTARRRRRRRTTTTKRKHKTKEQPKKKKKKTTQKKKRSSAHLRVIFNWSSTMAKMFIQSDDADVKELAVFETPPTNTSVTERCFLNFHPVSQMSFTSQWRDSL